MTSETLTVLMQLSHRSHCQKKALNVYKKWIT